MPDVFISYSHIENKYAHDLANEFKHHRIDAWIDDRIDYGTTWPHVIQENINASPGFIVIMSSNSYNSDWVQNEVSYAQGKKKAIFPILLEGDVWVSFASKQYVDLRNGEMPPNSYFETVKKRLGLQVVQPQPGDKVWKTSKPSDTQQLNAEIVEYILKSITNDSYGEWEIGIFRVTYSVPLKNPPKEYQAPQNYSLASVIINTALLRRYDPKTYLENKEDFDKLTFTPVHGYNIKMARTIEAEHNFIKRLNLELGMVSETGFTKTDVEKFAEQLIDIQKAHHIPLNEIKIKVVK